MRATRRLSILAVLLLLTVACTDPTAIGSEDRGNVIIGGAGSEVEIDTDLVSEYLVELEDHPGRRTRRTQLSLRSSSLGVDLLAEAVPKLKTCADPEVHPLLDEFASRLLNPPELRLGDVEFVTNYGYGIGLLIYYDLALQAADTEFGDTTTDDVYAACDLHGLSSPTVDAELASIEAVLESEAVLRVFVGLQPELVEWRACLGEAGIPVAGMPFVGLEDLDMLARDTFDKLTDQYFEVFVSLIDLGLGYRELVDASIEQFSAPETIAAFEHLKEIHAAEVSMAFLDQRCFDEHVATSYGEAQEAELQRLQRDWPNL